MATKTLNNEQLLRQPLLSGAVKGNLSNRFWAKFLDLVLLLLVQWVISWFSFWISFAFPVLFFATVDRWIGRQSPGKWLMGLHTLSSLDKLAKPSYGNCFMRNLPFTMLIMGWMLEGWFFYAIMGPAILWIAFEIYFLLTVRSAIRVGDVMGHTRVFDFKDQHTQFMEEYLAE